MYAVDDICNLCLANAEFREHFLIECSMLEKVRNRPRYRKMKPKMKKEK